MANNTILRYRVVAVFRYRTLQMYCLCTAFFLPHFLSLPAFDKFSSLRQRVVDDAHTLTIAIVPAAPGLLKMTERRLLILESLYPNPKDPEKQNWRVINPPGLLLHDNIDGFFVRPANCKPGVVEEVTKVMSFLATCCEW